MSPTFDILFLVEMHAAAVIGATPVSWRSILSNRQGGSRHRGACCAGLGCRLYGVTGVRKIGGENGMVVQPVHERYLVAGLGAALRFVDAGRPAFLVAYLLACFVTACQVTAPTQVLSRGYSGGRNPK